jgi:hypothetical protein
VVEALRDAGLDVDCVSYSDTRALEVAERLRRCKGVLVWVDPLSDDGERTTLDALLRDLAGQGLWVSTHPDVVDTIGTKKVLVDTRAIGWGSDTYLYASLGEFRDRFPARLAIDGVRVLKASRGNGGRTVWKVRTDGSGSTSIVSPEDRVLVQHAVVRDATETVMTFSELMSECERVYESWDQTECLIDQEYMPTIAQGLVRCYLVGDRVVGFARQYPHGTTARGPLDVHIDPTILGDRIFGLPSPKVMYDADEPAFAGLRFLVETQWVPGMQQLLAVETRDLPTLWDIDLLLGPASPDGSERFVLCEINTSCVIPFPPAAPAVIARHVLEHR